MREGEEVKRPFVFDPENPRRDDVMRLLSACIRGWGGRCCITVADPTRSLEQNARMWALLTDVSKQVQWPVDGRMEWLTPEDWKHIFTAGLKREQRVAQGIDGGFVILGQRTSQMSKREMGDLMTLIEAFGAERGVEWGEPERWAA